MVESQKKIKKPIKESKHKTGKKTKNYKTNENFRLSKKGPEDQLEYWRIKTKFQPHKRETSIINTKNQKSKEVEENNKPKKLKEKVKNKR